MEKLNQIRCVSSEIENMPYDLKSENHFTLESFFPKEAAHISPIESLLDNSYVDLSKIAEERTNEIKLLKAELSQLRLEHARICQFSETDLNGPKGYPQYQSLQENVVAILSQIKIPSLSLPTISTIDEYASTLRGILERQS